MKLNNRNAVAAVAAFGLLALSGSATATNGYFTHGVGTESKGMAGTGIGSDAAKGSIIGASNPALAVHAEDGWEVGLALFSPMRSFTAGPSLAQGQGGAFTISEGSFDSSSEWFPIPYVAKNFRLSGGSVINLAFYGRGGMNTDWDDPTISATSLACDPTGAAVVSGPGPYCGGPAGVDLSQAFLAVNWAGKAGENFSWGVGPVFAVQMFEATGVGAFTPFTRTFAESILGGGGPVPADSLTNNGRDTSTGYGFAGGVWWAMGSSFSAGLAYQSKMSMGEFDDYSDLFAEAGGFDIPATTKLGVSFKGTNNVRLNLDIEHIEYSDVASIANPMANLGACPTAGLGGTDLESCLGGANGGGFGWEDMTVFKLGMEWYANADTTYRFGYSYGEQPIQEADVMFNILAPGVMEQHLTFGMTKARANGGAWNLSFMYAPSNTVTGASMFDPTQELEIEMSQFEIEFSYLW
jgi:long-chain fatty acid transport protein